MALTQEQKDALVNALLANKRTSVDGLTVERRSAADIRDALEIVCDDLAETAPKERIHITSFDPPGALDG